MISVQKEELVRHFIRLGCLNQEIEHDTGAGHETVERIRLALKLGRKCPVNIREQIIFQLIGGFPIEIISRNLCVQEEVVLAVHRYCYIRSLRANEKQMAPVCSMCRRDIEAMYEEPREADKRDVSAEDLLPYANSLHDIACNIASLNDLGVIASPLFCGIASRASDILEEISGGIHGQEEN